MATSLPHNKLSKHLNNYYTLPCMFVNVGLSSLTMSFLMSELVPATSCFPRDSDLYTERASKC